MHRDLAPQLNVGLLSASEQVADVRHRRHALVLAEQDLRQPAWVLHPHAAVAERAPRLAEELARGVSCM